MYTDYGFHLVAVFLEAVQVDGFYGHPSGVSMVIPSVYFTEGALPEAVVFIDGVLPLFQIFPHVIYV